MSVGTKQLLEYTLIPATGTKTWIGKGDKIIFLLNFSFLQDLRLQNDELELPYAEDTHNIYHLQAEEILKCFSQAIVKMFSILCFHHQLTVDKTLFLLLLLLHLSVWPVIMMLRRQPCSPGQHRSGQYWMVPALQVSLSTH